MTQKRNTLLDQIQLGPVISYVAMVGPTAAQMLLESMGINRRLDPHTVTRYCHDMSAGNWLFTGAPIKIDTNGQLRDGQHRLSAIIKTGISVPLLVVEGLSPDAFSADDQGRKRSPGEVLTLRGYQAGSTLAAACHMTWQFWKRAPGAASVSPSIAQRLIVLARLPSLETSVLRTRKIDRVGPGSVFASLHCIAHLAGHGERADRFIDDVTSGAELSRRSPELALRERLLDEKKNMKRAMLNNQQRMQLIVRGWNAGMQQLSRDHLKATSSDGSFVIDPPFGLEFLDAAMDGADA
jgi:hypothetical protein